MENSLLEDVFSVLFGIYTLKDVDECSSQSHDCKENAKCTNNEGSYSCACNEIQIGDGRIRTSKSDVKQLKKSTLKTAEQLKPAVCTSIRGAIRLHPRKLFVCSIVFVYFLQLLPPGMQEKLNVHTRTR